MRVAKRGVLVAAVLMLLGGLAWAQADATLATLRHTTQLEPENVLAWIALGEAYLLANRLEEAKGAFLEAIALDFLAGDAHFGLGLTEYARGDYEAALFSFEVLTRFFPERFDAHFNRAVTLARLRRVEEAVESFQEALRQAVPEASDEDRVSAYLGLASQLGLVERFDEVVQAYEQALALRGPDTELSLRHGEALYRAGRGLEALPSLTELEEQTSDFRASALIADIYLQARQTSRALWFLQRALRRAEAAGNRTVQANLLINLGLLQRGLGREAEAVSSFSQAARLDPNSWQAHYNLGLSYLEGGQPRSALTALEQALPLNRDSGELLLALATAQDQLGLVNEALRNAQAAAGRLADPGLQSDATFIVGRSLHRLSDYRGALAALSQVVAAQPDNAAAQLWVGLAHFQLQEFRAAAQSFERAVQLDPNSLTARINLGAAYLAARRFQDAELVYQLILQQNANDAEAHFNLGWALISQGRREEARAAWQRAQQLGFQPAANALREHF